MLTKLLNRAAILAAGAGVALLMGSTAAHAVPTCPVTYANLVSNLQTAAAADSTGLNNNYWAVVVNRDGVVCAVAYSGSGVFSQWLLSRQIAAAKAFTANGLSLDSAPISSGMLYSTVQPNAPQNPLFGLPFGNPLDPAAAYAGNASDFGTASDPMIGKRVGGTITFGGGFGLYSGSTAVGGLGLSGDTACSDHSTAWRLRNLLNAKPTVGDDRIHLTNATPITKFGDHPDCPNDGGVQGTK